MNGLPRRDRAWLLGGVVVIAASVAIGWFLLIGPQLGQADSLRQQAANNQQQLAVLSARLTTLREQYRELPRYQAELATYLQALPTTPATSDLLRGLQKVGDGTGVVINGVTVSDPESVPGNTKVRALPVIVTASGSTTQLTSFIDQLQRRQPRAVLIRSVNLTGGAGRYTLSVNMNAFVASR